MKDKHVHRLLHQYTRNIIIRIHTEINATLCVGPC